MQHDYENWQRGFVDCFMFDNGINITIARHDGIVGHGKIWQGITWDAVNNVIDGPIDLYTYQDVATYIDLISKQYEGA